MQEDLFWYILRIEYMALEMFRRERENMSKIVLYLSNHIWIRFQQ